MTVKIIKITKVIIVEAATRRPTVIRKSSHVGTAVSLVTWLATVPRHLFSARAVYSLDISNASKNLYTG